MKVKRYVAPNMQEAMMKVKMDLGKEAVILHTRKYKKGGFFGLFGRTMFEITAAVEDHPIAVAQAAAARQQHSVTGLANYTDTARIDALQEELLSMREMVKQIAGHVQAAGENTASNGATDPSGKSKPRKWPKELDPLHEALTENDVEEKLAGEILARVAKKINNNVINGSAEKADADADADPANIELSPAENSGAEPPPAGQELLDKAKQALKKEISQKLKNPKPILIKDTCQTIALVGPTGVGKTTTIAKLAATFSLIEKKDVALVTADTYRIAAVEQLKTFSDIIGLQVEVAYTPAELKEAVQRHQDKDLVLIDTAGRSHRNVMQMSELRAFLDAAEPTDVIMVLSATAKYKDMLDVLESYADIPFSRIAFTKLDETSSCGAILNTIHRSKKALCYTTAGQNVPDDIEMADPAALAELMLKGEENHA